MSRLSLEASKPRLLSELRSQTENKYFLTDPNINVWLNEVTQIHVCPKMLEIMSLRVSNFPGEHAPGPPLTACWKDPVDQRS